MKSKTNNLRTHDSKLQSKRRLEQLAREERTAQALREEGFEVFSPTVVCDRIAVKNGKVFFVEFKKEGQTLRPGQQRIHDLMPDQYLVRIYEPDDRGHGAMVIARHPHKVELGRVRIPPPLLDARTVAGLQARGSSLLQWGPGRRKPVRPGQCSKPNSGLIDPR